MPAVPKLRRRRAQPAAPKPRPRPRSYYLVAGIALEEEMDRLRALPVFSDGPLAERRPELKVRRASQRPNRLGFAVPSDFRLSVTAYPGIRRGDVLETLLHELVHLHVGRAKEAHGWHGPTFKRVLSRAAREAYGVTIPIPRATLHGTYAEAIEKLLGETAKRAPGEPFLRSRG